MAIGTEDCERFPTKAPTAPDRWAHILDVLENSKIVSLPYSDDKQLRGLRVALGRRAKQRGLTLDVRTHDNTLAARKVETTGRPEVLDTTAVTAPRRGRRRRTFVQGEASKDENPL